MTLITLAIFGIYCLVMTLLIIGWWMSGKRSVADTAFQSAITVIVPVRNEERNIIQLLRSLKSQLYPPEKFEVLIVNDHSSDETEALFRKEISSQSLIKIRMIKLTVTTGKKAAITEGIRQAAGEIIVTTDADCTHHPKWLQSMTGQFGKSACRMVTGGIRIKPDGLMNSLHQIESAALTGIGASTLELGMPTMCSGANLAYRKEAFAEVGGYEGNEKTASGDDEFLLRKLFNTYSGGVHFNREDHSVVTTEPATSWTEFMNQRIRWAAKWRSYGLGFSAILAVFIFFFHLTILCLPLIVIYGNMETGTAVILFGAKIFFESIFLYQVMKFIQAPFNFISFLSLQFLYSPYVVFFGLTSNFLRADWKGRKI